MQMQNKFGSAVVNTLMLVSNYINYTYCTSLNSGVAIPADIMNKCMELQNEDNPFASASVYQHANVLHQIVGTTSLPNGSYGTVQLFK